MYLVSEEDAKFFLDNKESVDLETFINSCWNTVKPYILMSAAEYKPPTDLKEENSESTDKPEEWDQESEGRFSYFKLIKYVLIKLISKIYK